MFKKVLIANRGEIACRIIKTCRKLGIETVAVYSAPEGNPLHAELADESHVLPESVTPAGAYLDAESVADIAAKSGAGAIHPGYGFLSESPALAERCAERGVVFVGPVPMSRASWLTSGLRARRCPRSAFRCCPARERKRMMWKLPRQRRREWDCR